MTREEAIERLTFLQDNACNYYFSDEDEDALTMAIEALKQSERKKGKWNITDAYPHNVYCSECHRRYAQTHWSVWEDGSLPRNYCPNCGAYMETDK